MLYVEVTSLAFLLEHISICVEVTSLAFLLEHILVCFLLLSCSKDRFFQKPITCNLGFGNLRIRSFSRRILFPYISFPSLASLFPSLLLHHYFLPFSCIIISFPSSYQPFQFLDFKVMKKRGGKREKDGKRERERKMDIYREKRKKKRSSKWSWWAIHIPNYSMIFRSRMVCVCYFISSEWCLETKWSSFHLVECRMNSLHSKLWYIAMNFIANEANLLPYSLVWRIRRKMMGKECHILNRKKDLQKNFIHQFAIIFHYLDPGFHQPSSEGIWVVKELFPTEFLIIKIHNSKKNDLSPNVYQFFNFKF